MANYSILDSIISEGKADSFATVVYPDVNAPWTEPLPKDSEEKYSEHFLNFPFPPQ